MEKKKITFKERLNAFREYWRENWKKDCLYGFLCLVLGFCIARCTPVGENTASADTVVSYELSDWVFDSSYKFGAGEFLAVSGNDSTSRFAAVCYDTNMNVVYTLTFRFTSSYTVYYENFSESGRLTPLPDTDIYVFDWRNFEFYNNNNVAYVSYTRYIYSSTLDYYIVTNYVSPEPTPSTVTPSGLFEVFNGATVTYKIGHYDDTTHDTIIDKSFTAPIPVYFGISSFDFSFLYNALPTDIVNFDFTVGDFDESLTITNNTGIVLDISKLNVTGFVYNFSETFAFMKFNIGTAVEEGNILVLSYFGHFSLHDLPQYETSPFPFYSNYELSFVSGLSSEGHSILSLLDSIVVSYGDTYETGYTNGYESGYNYGLSVSNNDYNQAYDNGYDVAYNTINTLSPNYISGYNAGLSNINSSWVLSPVNAINTIFNLELFSVGDFHFKLSYLVYLSIGGLLVGVLIRFLFHS